MTTDVEKMAGLIMLAESANQTFRSRRKAINEARGLKERSRKSYAHYGMTKDSFAALRDKIETQLTEVNEAGYSTLEYVLNSTYADFIEAQGQARIEAERAARRTRVMEELSKADTFEEEPSASNGKTLTLTPGTWTSDLEPPVSNDLILTRGDIVYVRKGIVQVQPTRRRKRWWQFWR